MATTEKTEPGCSIGSPPWWTIWSRVTTTKAAHRQDAAAGEIWTPEQGDPYRYTPVKPAEERHRVRCC